MNTATQENLKDYEDTLRAKCRKLFVRASDWRDMAEMVEDAIKDNEEEGGHLDQLSRQYIQARVYREMQKRNVIAPAMPEAQQSPKGNGGGSIGKSTRLAPPKASEAQLRLIRTLIAERGLTLADRKLTEDHFTPGHFRLLSDRDARDEIHDLKTIPLKTRMMTNGQRDLLAKLMIENGAPEAVAIQTWNAMQTKTTFDDAKKLIDQTIAIKKARPSVNPDEGFYECGDLVVKVQKGVTTPNIYAKTLQVIEGVGVEWDYQGLAAAYFKKLHDPKPLSKERALQVVEEIGADLELYGACWMCGRKLTDEESIARRIGRICFNKCC